VTVDFAADAATENTTDASLDASLDASGEAGDEPSIVYTVYLSTADEVVEHIRAADVLNLGFRVESYVVSSDDAPDTTPAEFEFTLFSELPVRVDERD
jgi:hypothetical protein